MAENTLPKIDDIKIHKVKIYNEGQLLATVELEYLGFILRGFRVSRSIHFDKDVAEQVWIQAPSVSSYAGRYLDLIRISDKSVWQDLKRKIVREYKLENDKYYKEKFGESAPTPAISIIHEPDIEPEVNVNDIEF